MSEQSQSSYGRSAERTKFCCDCGVGTLRYQADTPRNKNRWFLKCSNWQQGGGCKFFLWEDLLLAYQSELEGGDVAAVKRALQAVRREVKEIKVLLGALLVVLIAVVAKYMLVSAMRVVMW
ncbi:hypothetical protein ACP70R_050089 [Stipagrostis hirtigluma subsp. patula]